jgi:hypothetical protein
VQHRILFRCQAAANITQLPNATIFYGVDFALKPFPSGARSHLVELAERFHQDQGCSVGLSMPSPPPQRASTDIKDGDMFDENAFCTSGLAPKALDELLRLTLGQR